jgi:hypothetical protein
VLFEPRTGAIVWQSFTITDEEQGAGASGASIWTRRAMATREVPIGISDSGPAVSRGHVYVGTGDAVAATFGGASSPGAIAGPPA